MDKKKMRLYLVRALLIFVIFVYVLSVIVGIFGNPNFALALFAYNTFLSVILYFLIGMQRRLDKWADDTQKQIEDDSNKETTDNIEHKNEI